MKSKALMLLFFIGSIVFLLNPSDFPEVDKESHIYKLMTHCDFYYYWKASKVLISRGNSYDPMALASVNELGLEDGAAGPLMMWNPPWVPVLLIPFAMFSFPKALALWFFCSISILLYFCFRQSQGKRLMEVALVALSCLSFAPVIESLKFAQMGLLLALGVLLTMSSFEKRSIVMLCVGMVLLSIKFHLFIVFFAALLAKAVRTFSLPKLASGIFVTIVFISLPMLFRSSIFSEWLTIIFASNKATFIPTSEWATSSSLSFFRIFFPSVASMVKASTVGCGLVIATFFYLLYLLKKKTLNESLLGDALVVSCVLCPYLWLYDFSILLPLQLIVIDRYFRHKSASAVYPILLIFLQAITFVCVMYVWHDFKYYFWYSWVFGAIWYCDSRLNNPQVRLPVEKEQITL